MTDPSPSPPDRRVPPSWLLWLRALNALGLGPSTLGRRGEWLAQRWLRRLGYRVVAQSHRDRLGELDLVALDGRVVVFVEVKTRHDDRHANPAEAVDQDKQRRITRAAVRFLKRHGLLGQAIRFDIVAVTWPHGERPRLRHYAGAFDATGHDSMFT